MSITHTLYTEKAVVHNIQHITTHNTFILLSKTLMMMTKMKTTTTMMMIMMYKSVILPADLCGFETLIQVKGYALSEVRSTQ